MEEELGANIAAGPEGSAGQSEAAELDRDTLDVARLQVAFRRFKVPDSGDLHRADLSGLLRYLGHVMVDEEGIEGLVKQVTNFEYLDFEELLDFMVKYIPYEQEQFRLVFEQFDEDGNGEFSYNELWQLLAELGFMPLKNMMHEALHEVDADVTSELGFEEFVRFLRAYRAQEGFTKEEVRDLQSSFAYFAQDGGELLRADVLCDALVTTFGLHIQDFAKQLEQQLRSGQGFQQSTTASQSPSQGGRAVALQFPEFLIFARRVREAAFQQLKCDLDFEMADTDKSGGISELELRRALQRSGYTPLRHDMQEILAEALDGEWHKARELDFNQFFGFMMVARQREGFTRASVQLMRQVFERFDEDKSQEVSALELSELFRHLGYDVDMDAIHIFVTQVDANGSEELDFREFLRLMRLHREAELKKYRDTFQIYCDRDEERMPRRRLVRALEELDLELSKELQRRSQKEGAEFLTFDDFVEMVDACRFDWVQKQRRNASFSPEKVSYFRDFFNRFDKDGSGDIDRTELGLILRQWGWEPRTLEQQAALMRKLETARARAHEAGVETFEEGSTSLTFWTFLQLARMLETEQLRAEEERLSQLMAELHFTTAEVEQFREIFCHRKRESFQEGSLRDPMHIAFKTGADGQRSGLPREGVRRIMRLLVVTITQDEKKQLDEVQTDLLNEEGLLDFHGFLRLMRWLLDTDFAGINGRLAKKAEQAPKN